ncbi:MAG: DUF4143 domain-containing protein [Clostridia bacterium]|nr:DUF4143 domain-containing protein [Clostridia bacterium]
MQRKLYRPRIIDKTIIEYLAVFGAICIEGPKWCGKTWTSSFHSKSEIFLSDPNGNFQNRTLAQTAPSLVLEGDTPRMIDEWQEVPMIWDAVRHFVDQRPGKGQFILTGSSTPNHKGILHSGAGRIASLRMRPMSLYESGDSLGNISLEQLCKGILNPCKTDQLDLRKIIDLILRGGWPESIKLLPKQAMLLPKAYLSAIINNDVYRVDGIKRDLDKIKLLLRSLARNESTTVSNNTLIRDIKKRDDEDIDTNTVSSYLNIFERLFIIENQLPFASSIRSKVRVRQQQKRHFTDPSLACALLSITPDMLINDLETLGFLFEAMCERDLNIYAESFGARLYHYQDYKNREIDAVIQLSNGNWCAFEIKLGANQIDDAARNLLSIKKAIEEEDGKAPCSLCVICGMSNAAYRRDDGVFVVPITELKN